MRNGQESNPWLKIFKPSPSADLRLFCFPYAGGGSLLFKRWHERLPPNIEVCAIQLPGREARHTEKPFDSLPLLVKAMAEPLLQCLDKPFAFFGYSMGALISFELARWLRNNGSPTPNHLLACARAAPQLTEADTPIQTLSDAEFIEKLRELKGTPEEILNDRELLQLILPFVRADFTLCQTYAYAAEPPLGCPITALGGVDDCRIPAQSIQAWCEQTTSSFSYRLLAGGHFFFKESLPLLLDVVSQELYKVTSKIRNWA